MIDINEFHNIREGSDLFPVLFEKVMTSARFVEEYILRKTQRLEEENALKLEDCNSSTEGCFMQ